MGSESDEYFTLCTVYGSLPKGKSMKEVKNDIDKKIIPKLRDKYNMEFFSKMDGNNIIIMGKGKDKNAQDIYRSFVFLCDQEKIYEKALEIPRCYTPFVRTRKSVISIEI